MSSKSSDYFDGYNDLKVHRLMIDDTARNDAYAEAIAKAGLEGKTVLDVGSGTGFLSLLALKAGARKVYAIEAASSVAELSRQIAGDNGVDVTAAEPRLVIINQRVEDVELGEKVDVIVSEWMGFYLFNESMLDSVIFARDRWLKPGGLLLPDKATIYACPVSLEAFWRDSYFRYADVNGVNLEPLGRANLEQILAASYQLIALKPEQLLAEPAALYTVDLTTARADELEFEIEMAAVTTKPGRFHGVTVFFDVSFLDGAVVLSTSPAAPETHWKQTTILLPTAEGFSVPAGEVIESRLSLTRQSDNPRAYSATLSF